jgi:hypothetical protein
VAGALLLQSRMTVHTGYGLLLPGFIMMGAGMGLVMSPMSTAAMNAVDRTKAGVASGTLSMSRMVGGTFGVAVMGALITTIGRAKIDERLPHLPAHVRSAIATLESSGGSMQGRHALPQIASAAHDAFISALSTGLTIGAAITLVGALLAWRFISPTPASHPQAAAPELTPA